MCGEIDAKGQTMDAAFCFTQGAKLYGAKRTVN